MNRRHSSYVGCGWLCGAVVFPAHALVLTGFNDNQAVVDPDAVGYLATDLVPTMGGLISKVIGDAGFH